MRQSLKTRNLPLRLRDPKAFEELSEKMAKKARAEPQKISETFTKNLNQSVANDRPTS